MRHLFKALVITVGLFTTILTPAYAQKRNMLDAYELGSFNAMEEFGAIFAKDYKRYENAWAVTQHHRRSGANHDHSDQLQQAGCRVAFRMINT